LPDPRAPLTCTHEGIQRDAQTDGRADVCGNADARRSDVSRPIGEIEQLRVALVGQFRCCGRTGSQSRCRYSDGIVEYGTGAVAPGSADAAGPATNVAVKEESVDSGTYGVRLRDLEQRINELKEQIFRSKARLSLLAETVLQGVVAGSQARIVHQNKMGNSYKLVKVVYALDGAPIFNKSDEEGGLGEQDEFDIYNGSMVPGEHTLTVKFAYRGHGYGIFSYLKGYRFNVSSSHTFTAPEGKSLTLEVVGYEKGGPTTPLEERPAVRFVERVAATAAPADIDKPAPPAGAGGG
jgi:hypothetical protein